MKRYRATIWEHCWWKCTECTWQDGKGWSSGLGNRWRLRNIYNHTEPKWVSQLECKWELIMAKTNFHRSCLPQAPLAVYANDLRLTIHILRMLRNGFSEWYWGVVSLNSVFVSFTPTIAEKNRRHIFDNDVLHSLLAKIDNLDDTKRLQYHLQIIHRQLGDSPEQVRFRDLVRHASQEGLSREEWEFLDSRTERKLTSEVRKLFDNAACLYTIRNDVNDLNLTELQALNQPCARINTRHDGGSDTAKVVSPRQTAIYVMYPTAHDIWSLFITTPPEPCQEMLM